MSKKNSNVILKNQFKDHVELSHIYKIFKKRISFFKKKSFVIAVSGGPDSLALTALAKSFSYENHQCKIYYVLVNHNIRRNSSKEAQLVKKLLRGYYINLNILQNKIKIQRNIQSKAREIRYDLLTNFCEKKKVKSILTAHNLEDQVETFFIRLSRGSGLQGLSSMNQINKLNPNLTLIRPLLDFKKIELIKISKLIFGRFYKDPTNKSTKYLRTRIRNLKKSLETSGIKYDQVFKSIKNLASSRDTLDLYFKKIYKDLASKKKKKVFINIKKFNNLNNEMKMKVLKKGIKDISKAYYSPRIQKIINLIEQLDLKKNTKLTLGGCLIFKEKNQIILEKENKIKVFS